MEALNNIDENGAQCRDEDAIYFASGMVLLLSGTPDNGYSITEKTDIADLIAAEPEGWTDIYFMHHCFEGPLTAIAGETSFGGAGFVALRETATGKFIWVLHLSNSNNFMSVSFHAGTVVAVSDYFYPDGAMYTIPIEAPERFRVEHARET